MSAIEQLKEIAKLVQKLGDLELLKRISDLQTEVFELHDANRTLRDRLSELEGKLAFRDRLVHEHNSYWLKDGEKVDGPFCARCYDKDGAARRMLEIDSGRALGCPTCTLVLMRDGQSIVDDRMRSRVQGILMQVKPK